MTIGIILYSKDVTKPKIMILRGYHYYCDSHDLCRTFNKMLCNNMFNFF